MQEYVDNTYYISYELPNEENYTIIFCFVICRLDGKRHCPRPVGGFVGTGGIYRGSGSGQGETKGEPRRDQAS